MSAQQKKVEILHFCLSATFFYSSYIVCSLPIFNAHLAEGWYHKDPIKLQAQVATCLQAADKKYSAYIPANLIKALIVPHAGLAYSGDIAAAAYRLIRGADITRIIVLAPDHSGTVAGCALPSFTHYAIPTGTVRLDTLAMSQLLNYGIHKNLQEVPLLIKENDAPFNTEHSFEMQLPFIHAVASSIPVVPVIVGRLTCTQANTVAQYLKKIIDDHTLVIVSTDLIHYGKRFNYTPFSDFAYLRVREYNGQAIRILQKGTCEQFDTYLGNTGATMCGASPLKVLLALRELNVFGSINGSLLAYGTSIKNDEQVLLGQKKDGEDFVCYASLVYSTQPIDELALSNRFTSYEKHALMQEARAVLANIFTHVIPQDSEHLLYPLPTEALQSPYGAFVTLKNKDGSLRGCIGRIVTHEPLYKTIATVTRDAALNDPRFSPVTQKEYKDLMLEISILGPTRAIATEKEIDLGADGIIIEYGGKSALFLPEVATEQQWDLEQTLDALSDKAGIDRTTWRSRKAVLKVFSTLKIIS